MTSRRAERRTRALERATVARSPATPGRELERRPAAKHEPISGAALAAAIPPAPGSVEPEHDRAARLARDAGRARMLAANWEAGDPARLGYGLLPWWRVARVQVPPDLRRDFVIGGGWPTECYQRALAYVMDHADHGVILVHGLLVERGRLWPHAWAEIGGQAIYDPSPGDFFDRDSFHEVLQPTIVGVFTPSQAASRAMAEDSPGPWGAYRRGQPGYALAVEAVSSLSEDYARTFPELFAWVQEMRSHDDRFAGDLAALMKSDLLAIGDLLASLVEDPALWRDHAPGAPWPYRLRKHPDHARVILPEIA